MRTLRNVVLFATICFVALTLSANAGESATKAPSGTPSFSLAWSEYPSWSAIEVASGFKHIDGRKGMMGPIERKWNVDIVLDLMDYDSCLQAYSAFTINAVCITNMDVLNPSLSRPSVAVLPTSTSAGADALIVDSSITKLEDLKGKNVFGLSASVSEFAFVQILRKNGLDPKGFSFTNMDPGAASLSMQQGNKGYSAIMVWNPFVINTLAKRKDVRVLASSSEIPNQIVDMVVIGEDSIKKNGGREFACAVIDAYYVVCAQLNGSDKSVADNTLIAIGEKFSNLGLQEMRKAVRDTRFYSTPDDGIGIYESQDFSRIMEEVTATCLDLGILKNTPSIVYGGGVSGSSPNLRFDSSFMKEVKAKAGK
jgi:hypothetical protein